MDLYTVHQAYLAMYSFLKYFYQITGNDGLGGLLGGMSLLESRGSADQGIVEDWRNEIELKQRKRRRFDDSGN
jgi:hypothetical protein